MKTLATPANAHGLAVTLNKTEFFIASAQGVCIATSYRAAVADSQDRPLIVTAPQQTERNAREAGLVALERFLCEPERITRN